MNILDHRLGFKVCGKSIPLLSFSIKQDIDAISCAWEAQTDWDHKDLIGKAGQEVELFLFGKQRTAILDQVFLSLPAEVSLAGRDKTSLVIDSSTPKKTFPKGQSFLSIGNKILEPFSMSFQDPKSLGDKASTRSISTEDAESCGDFLTELAKEWGFFLGSDDGKSLVIRSFDEDGACLSLSKDSPLKSLSVSRNMISVFGVYDYEHKKTVGIHKDPSGHPLKRKKLRTQQTKAGLEMEARRKKSLSVNFSMSDLVDLKLGQKVSFSWDDLVISGVIGSLEWVFDPQTCETNVEILWSGKHSEIQRSS